MYTTMLSVGGSVAVAFVTAYFTTVVKLRQEHLLDIDRDLRDARIKAYKRPWKALIVLSMHRPQAPTFTELGGVVNELTNWYYTEGGLYLTQHSQPAFVACVEAVRDTSRTKRDRETEERVSDEIHKLLYDIGSAFRTQMTLDLGSRFESDFRTQRHKRQRRQAAERSADSKADLQKQLTA